MKKLFPLFILLISCNVSGQVRLGTAQNRSSFDNSTPRWEDKFWRNEVKERYEKTSTMAGLYTVFYRNGQIRWQGKCLENGTPDSTWVYYGGDGKKIWEGSYNGKYTEYSWYDEEEDGNPLMPASVYISGNYRNGLKDGEWLQYDSKGNVTRKGYYTDGRPTGTWQKFKEIVVVTNMEKSEEYNFATGIRIFYNKDSVTRTEKVDSLTFADDHDFNLQQESSDYVNAYFNASVHYIDFDQLNRYFLQPGSHPLSNQVGALGFEYSGGGNGVYGALNVSWIPAVTADLNDSVRLRLAGFFSSVSIGGDLLHSDVVQIIPSIGIGFQRLRLKVSNIHSTDTTGYTFSEGESRVYRNPSPTLDGMLNLRLNLNWLSLGIAGGYSLDCAGTRWKYNGRYLDASPRTSASGLVLSVSLGFHIPS
ncbi:MAG: hypothetical protein JWO44_846 [Bacteroidetes bacterium]|nr:hypothetical protein [Bacteroidota bacterium]